MRPEAHLVDADPNPVKSDLATRQFCPSVAAQGRGGPRSSLAATREHPERSAAESKDDYCPKCSAERLFAMAFSNCQVTRSQMIGDVAPP